MVPCPVVPSEKFFNWRLDGGFSPSSLRAKVWNLEMKNIGKLGKIWRMNEGKS